MPNLASFFFLIYFLVSLAPHGALAHQSPRAEKGVLDLSQWDFESHGPIELSGEYEFHWRRLLLPDSLRSDTPASHFIDVPGGWNGYELNGEPLPAHGFATYRLMVLLQRPLPNLALKFLDMGTAYRVFVNGDTLLSVGKVGTTPESSQPRYFPQVVDFSPDTNRIELVYHVSNFHHRRGGVWEVIKLGTEEQITGLRQRRLWTDLAVFGAILIIGLYHIALFALRTREHSTLYFGLFCLFVALRMLTTVERILLQVFPALPWEVFVKIEYLSFALAAPLFVFYLDHVFPGEPHRRIVRGVAGISVLFACAVMLTPVRIFSHLSLSFQIFLVVSMSYVIWVLWRAISRRREGAAIFLFGFLFLAAAVVNDMLDANGVIQTGHFAHYGLLAFIFSQSFLLSFRFSKAFSVVERQRQELEQEIAERKRAEKENRELQEKLMRAQKMEAVGGLAGGVAHDLNNILTGMVTYPDLLLMDLPGDSYLRAPLETIRDTGLKAAAVVQDLLTLARQGVLHFEVLNLNDIVTEYLHSSEHDRLMLEHRDITIETRLGSDLLNINGSPFHLRKTIMNLTANAAEAQPQGGRIVIATENRYVDHRVDAYEKIEEGDYAVLSVADHGCGIPKEDLGKIFEPFYTKKIMGRSGTGLGMTVVWGTVHDHDGAIDVKTSSGKGTTFELYFRVTSDTIAEKSAVPVREYMGRNERILVVDDIEEQRIIACKILSKLGYQVDAVASGEAAIEYVEKQRADLVLLDMIMDPGLDGLETFRELKKMQPDVKAVIASGYAATHRVKTARKLGAGRYLKKPYTLEKLGLMIREELERRA